MFFILISSSDSSLKLKLRFSWSYSSLSSLDFEEDLLDFLLFFYVDAFLRLGNIFLFLLNFRNFIRKNYWKDKIKFMITSNNVFFFLRNLYTIQNIFFNITYFHNILFKTLHNKMNIYLKNYLLISNIFIIHLNQFI